MNFFFQKLCRKNANKRIIVGNKIYVMLWQYPSKQANLYGLTTDTAVYVSEFDHQNMKWMKNIFNVCKNMICIQ